MSETPRPVIAQKVTALVTCRHQARDYLLIFRHPYVGIQIPAGTVEEGEDLSDAARREAQEETGLADFGPGRYLGVRKEALPERLRLMATTAYAYARPDVTSFCWASLRRGIAVRVERQEGDFVQVTYEEWDRLEKPQYVTYCISGWVPIHTLATHQERHFYHFEVTGDPAQRWEVETDNHRFRLFWAPLDDLPEIVWTQASWVEMLSSS